MSLVRRAANQEYLKQHETYLRMALKAQNQSRMTLQKGAAGVGSNIQAFCWNVRTDPDGC
jgi:hypothetical protein